AVPGPLCRVGEGARGPGGEPVTATGSGATGYQNAEYAEQAQSTQRTSLCLRFSLRTLRLLCELCVERSLARPRTSRSSKEKGRATRRRAAQRLAAGQAHGALLGVLEGAAGLRDAVDPGLQLAGDGEVVHGRAHDDDVRGQELAHQLLGNRVLALLRFGQAGG